MIEARVGELAYEEPRRGPLPIVTMEGGGRRPSGEPSKHERLGLTQRQMRTSQAIASHPEEVAEVVKEAEENEDIPTKTAVLNKIAYKREQARKKERREKNMGNEA